MATSHHSNDQAGRHAAQRNPANDCEHRQTETAVKSFTENESRRGGNRQGGEGLVPDVLAHIPMPRGAIG
jgi:hypothetical protein